MLQYTTYKMQKLNKSDGRGEASCVSRARRAESASGDLPGRRAQPILFLSLPERIIIANPLSVALSCYALVAPCPLPGFRLQPGVHSRLCHTLGSFSCWRHNTRQSIGWSDPQLAQSSTFLSRLLPTLRLRLQRLPVPPLPLSRQPLWQQYLLQLLSHDTINSTECSRTPQRRISGLALYPA